MYHYCIFSKLPPYMYITTSYNLCSICIHSMEQFKLIPLLSTHIYSFVLWKVHPLKSGGGNMGKLGCNGMWLWSVNQLILWEFYNEKPIRRHFIWSVTTLETWPNWYWHWTWYSLANDSCRIWYRPFTKHWTSRKFPPRIPDWEKNNLWFWTPFLSYDLSHVYSLVPYEIANMLKLQVFKSIGGMIPESLRCPH